MITIVTLMAGRFYCIDAYFHGLENIDYPKDQINLVFMTNSENADFKYLIERRINNLKGYANQQLFTTDSVPPSSNAFVENGVCSK